MAHFSPDAGPYVNAAYTKVPTGEPSPFEVQSNGQDEYITARTGIARLFTAMTHKDSVDIEKRSVYGSALAIPQLARSAGWPLNLTLLALRSYLFLLVNVLLQGVFLYMIEKSEEVTDKFAGQMKLCDFGAGIRQCPDGAGCVGPGGTRYTPARMYSFDAWTTRIFVKASLEALFPEKLDSIDEIVDPGEYGQESHMCRFLCCFLFMASLMSELVTTLNMARLLIMLPTGAASWVKCDPGPGSQPRLILAGMSACWKLANWIFVFLPKLILWRLTVSAGINFLLDTSGITDVIINTVALNFILGIDELLFESLTAPETRWLMDALESFNLMEHERRGEDDASRQAFVEGDVAERMRESGFSFKIAIPIRLIGVIVLTVLFVAEYYYLNCIPGDEGTYISRPLFLPASVDFPLMSFLFPWVNPPTVGDRPIWEMPAT